MVNIVNNKPKTIKLSDGNEYTLSPIDLNMADEIEEHFDESLGELLKQGLKAKLVRYILYCMLKPSYPDLTEQQVGALGTMATWTEIYTVIAEAMGAK